MAFLAFSHPLDGASGLPFSFPLDGSQPAPPNEAAAHANQQPVAEKPAARGFIGGTDPGFRPDPSVVALTGKPEVEGGLRITGLVEVDEFTWVPQDCSRSAAQLPELGDAPHYQLSGSVLRKQNKSSKEKLVEDGGSPLHP